MSLNFIRPAFALLWLFVALAILLRKTLGLDFFERWDDSDLNFGAIFAIALALWNGFRWWSSRRIQSENSLPPNPLRPRENSRPFEYNPELDFTKPSDDAPVRKG
jgi:hypothetical protein